MAEEESGTVYRAKQDITLPRVIAKIKGEGEDAEYATEGANYPAGSLIPAQSMLPRDRKRAESGQMSHLLDKAPDMDHEQVQHLLSMQTSGEPEFGVFIAEHEAEAHALEQYGHHVVPHDQEMELLSSSAAHHKQYQEMVKSAGLDARPNLEATHPRHRERVPDEMLYGAETRTGAPYQRGESEHDEEEEGTYTRRAPGVSSGQERRE